MKINNLPDEDLDLLDLQAEYNSIRADFEAETVKCPFCGTDAKEWCEANGPDDYRKVLECPNCGRYDE